MGYQLGWGLLLVFVGGVLNGSFAAPMKRLSAWQWENIWLVYSLVGLLVLSVGHRLRHGAPCGRGA